MVVAYPFMCASMYKWNTSIIVCASRAVERQISKTLLVVPVRQDIRTLQGLFNSKPAGATGLSVCPRRYPVNLRSRSITTLVLVLYKEQIWVN